MYDARFQYDNERSIDDTMLIFKEYAMVIDVFDELKIFFS